MLNNLPKYDSFHKITDPALIFAIRDINLNCHRHHAASARVAERFLCSRLHLVRAIEMKNPVLPAEQNCAARPAAADARKPSSFSGGAAPGAGNRQATRSLFRPLIFNTPARETSGARAAVEADMLSGAAAGIAGEPGDHGSVLPEFGGFDRADVCAERGVAENGNLADALAQVRRGEPDRGRGS